MKENEENIEIEKISELLKKAETDDGTFYGALYDLKILIGIAIGINQINNGNFITLEEFRKDREAFYARTLRQISQTTN